MHAVKIVRRQQTRVRLFEIGDKFNVAHDPHSHELHEVGNAGRHRNGYTMAAAVGQPERTGRLLRREGDVLEVLTRRRCGERTD